MKSLRGIRLRYFALALAVIAIGVGVWQTFFQGQGYVKTQATITAIQENEYLNNDEITYDVTVAYTVDGVEYTGLLGSYSPSYQVGNTVTVKYDPADPSKFVDGSGIGFVFLIIGAAVLAVVIATWVMGANKQKAQDASKDAVNSVTYAPSRPGLEREVYFITDLGTPKYGHRIEDASRSVLYEAKMTKFSMLQPCGFDFIDHEHGTTTPHLIGHTETYEWDSFFIDDHSTFTFDGEYIWKHLKRNGITVDSSLNRNNLLKAQFVIYRDGKPMATALATSQYVHEEDAAAHKIMNAMPAMGHYRVFTTETNLDLLFVTLMAFTRSGALTDEGGARKAVVNTFRQ